MINKRQKNIIEKLVNASFDPKGEIKEKIISENVKVLKKLSSFEAISILTLYYKGLKREISKTTLEISSPIPLSLDQKNKITKIASKNFRINNTKIKIDPSLFGGLRIKIGDIVFDDSIQNKIGQMKGFING